MDKTKNFALSAHKKISLELKPPGFKKDKPYLGPTFTIVSNKADDDLLANGHTNSECRVYFNLCRHYNRECNQSWPSIGTISDETGIDRRSVSRALKELSFSGMILITKSKNNKSVYENNVYYLPHSITLQIEQLLEDRTNLKGNKKRINDLKELKDFVLQSITEYIGRGNSPLRRGNNPLRNGKIAEDRGKINSTVGAITPTNNTTINITNNITKNVNNKETSDNEDLPIGLKSIKRYDNEFSKVSTEAIGNSNTLLKIKREGIVQQLANDLNDAKSIPFFRSIVSKFTDHEDTIYKCLSLTRETQELAGIKTSRGAVFTDHIKREAERLGIAL